MLSHVQVFVTPRTVAYEAPPSMTFFMLKKKQTFNLWNLLLDLLKSQGRAVNKFSKEIFPKNMILDLQWTILQYENLISSK